MTRLLATCFAVWAIIDTGQTVSTKLDFEEDESPSATSNSSKEAEDVEVQHTIVVSTKLKNNNRRGLHNNDADKGDLTYSIGHNKKEDSGEVPVINGFKSVDSTVIRTPDTREKPPLITESVFINRNIRDQYDTYPIATNPTQWQPSSFFNNVNWWNDDNTGFNDYNRRRNWQINRNQATLHRKITDDGVKEFYCRKCRELSTGSGTKGCVQQRSNSWFYDNTTPKIKIDGKIAKFN